MEKGWLSHLKMIAFTQALHSNFILQTDRHSWRKEKVIQVELSLDAAQTEIVMKGATKRSNSGNNTLKKSGKSCLPEEYSCTLAVEHSEVNTLKAQTQWHERNWEELNNSTALDPELPTRVLH